MQKDFAFITNKAGKLIVYKKLEMPKYIGQYLRIIIACDFINHISASFERSERGKNAGARCPGVFITIMTQLYDKMDTC